MSGASAGSADDAATSMCYRCKQTGHFAKDCPLKRAAREVGQENAAPAPAPTPTLAAPTPTPAPAPTSSDSTTTASAEPDMCYRCKTVGHRAKDCPTKGKNQDVSASSSASPAPTSSPSPTSDDSTAASADAAPVDMCYRCKGTGHRAKDCPQKRKNQVDSNDQNDSSSMSSSTTAPSSSLNGRRHAHATNDSSYERPVRSCYVCQSTDHMSRECPTKAATAAAAASAAAAAKTHKPCARCESLAHLTIDCPHPKACFHCQSPDHLTAECEQRVRDQREKVRQTVKPCFTCQSTDHISRECPQAGAVVVYRNTSKDRTLNCYVCGKVGHHATDCPLPQEIQDAFAKLLASKPSTPSSPIALTARQSLSFYNSLLDKCSRALEYRGALFLYAQMQEHGVAPNDDTMAALSHLYQVSGKDQSRVKGLPATRKPRVLLKEILQSWKMTNAPSTMQRDVDAAAAYLATHATEREACEQRFAVASLLARGLSWGQKHSREVLAVMKSQGYFVEKKKRCVWHVVDDGSRIAPNKAAVAAAAAAAGKSGNGGSAAAVPIFAMQAARSARAQQVKQKKKAAKTAKLRKAKAKVKAKEDALSKGGGGSAEVVEDEAAASEQQQEQQQQQKTKKKRTASEMSEEKSGEVSNGGDSNGSHSSNGMHAEEEKEAEKKASKKRKVVASA